MGKYLVLLGAFAFCLSIRAQTPNLTGVWDGILSQPLDPADIPTFPIELSLTESTSGAMTGTINAHVVYNGTQYSATFNVTGQASGDTSTFQDTSFLAGTAAPLGYGWCVSSYTLTYSVSGSTETLTGPWQAPYCTGGTITVTRSTSGSIPAGAVVNGASFLAGNAAAGTWLTIVGTNLAAVTDTWDNSIVNGVLPTTLDSVTVNVNGTPAYVNFVSPTQLNVLAPATLPGNATLTVTNLAGTSAPINVTFQNVAPAFFLWNNQYAVATHQDYSLAVKNGTFPGLTTTPAAPGETIILWGSGFGATTPAAPTGIEIPSGSIYATSTPVTVTVGGIPAQVFGAALAPGFAGLYQIAIQMPASAPNGDLPVIATVDDVTTPNNTLTTVQQ